MLMIKYSIYINLLKLYVNINSYGFEIAPDMSL